MISSDDMKAIKGVTSLTPLALSIISGYYIKANESIQNTPENISWGTS